MNIVWRALPVWAILFVVTGFHSGFSGNTALSCALTLAVLTLAAAATKAAGWPLIWMLFFLDFGINWLNTMDEAVLFHVVAPKIALQGLVYGAVVSFGIAVLLAFALKRMRRRTLPEDDDVAPVNTSWIWRFAAAACVYVALYFIAGISVHPFIKAFYANRWLPSNGELCAIQFFRGLLYSAVALPFLRRMTGKRLPAGAILGLCFSVLGGIAPLLLSNPYMPAHIRLAHSMEVGISNFIFGLIVAALFVARSMSGNVEDSGRSRMLRQDATV